MTSIDPEAFDRKPIIECIKKSQLALDNLLEEATNGDLGEAILKDSDRELVELRRLLQARMGLLRLVKIT